MIKTNIILPLFVSLFLLVGSANANKLKQQKYKSPNGSFVSYIMPVSETGHGSRESKIIIKTNKGRILCSTDYGSQDGEHGFGVVRAAWTPDSHFFVYSMSNSGGHQPWHSPIDFISTTDFRVRSLDDYVGPIMNPKFQLKQPDIIKAAKQKDTLKEEPFEMSLSELLKK